METLYEPILGLSKDMVLGLPISVEMFFTGISMLIAGFWIDRRGWHEAFFTGLCLSIFGSLYSWLAFNAFQFILSRGIVGLGYGLALMASQGFVIVHTSDKNKAQGLALLFAGVYAGSICGSAVGAMLAERVGYRPVFLAGAIIIFLAIGYTVLFMRDAVQKPAAYPAESRLQAATFGQVIRFFFDRNVFSLFLLSIFPSALAVVGFLNYFSPIYLSRIGASQSNIGRIFMLYGVCLIYVAPFISKYIDASRNQKMYIVMSGLLGSFALITFYYVGGVAATAAAVLLLGLSGSFGASQRSYILKLNVSQQLGAGKAMGVFNSVYRVGQVLGPLTFGWLVISVEITKGLTYLGLAYLFVTALFLFFAQSGKTILMKEG